jgi:putative DNA primase/helicase
VTFPFPIRPARRDDDPGGGDTNGHVTSHEPLTDLGNARRLVTAHGDRIRYVPLWRRWLIWDGKRWADDDTGQVWRCAKHVARGMLHSAADAPTTQERDRLIAAARRAESATGLRAMVELAGTEKTIALAPAQLDADPWTLNVGNGILDLRTLDLAPHDPAAHLTKVTAAGYRPDATAPRFAAFLQRVQPDETMRAYLARVFGYSLLGKVAEHILPIPYGTGANGKSTLIKAATAALGSYAASVDPDLLVDRGSSHPTGVADLFGLRLAVTHETDEGRRLAEGTVKRLTGGDKIKARRMHKDFFEFEPSHLVLMLTNHRPVIRGDDSGIWRRIRLIPFDVAIPEDEQDTGLDEALELEADGILAWMVAGYRDYQARGLDDPARVRAATAEYRSESDDLGRFLEQCCLTGPHFHVRAGDLFSAWEKWCGAENVKAGSQTAFGRTLTDRGFDNTRRGGQRVWLGVALASDEEQELS